MKETKSIELLAKRTGAYSHRFWHESFALGCLWCFYSCFWTFSRSSVSICFLIWHSLTFRRRKVMVVGKIGASDVFLSRKITCKCFSTFKHQSEVKVQVRLLSLADGNGSGIHGYDGCLLNFKVMYIYELFLVCSFYCISEFTTCIWTSGRSLWTGFLVDSFHNLHFFALHW